LTPYVSDFGLAKRIEPSGTRASLDEATPMPRALRTGKAWQPADPQGERLTEPGVVVGTPTYMAPEQAGGGKALTTATDVYGLGALLYKLLTGKPPLDGGSVEETLRQVKECAPRPPRTLNPHVDPRLEAVCLKCLAKEPAARYGSAEALAEDLERWLRREPPLAWPLPARLRAWRALRRHLVVGTATAVCGFAVAIALLIAHYSDPDRQFTEIQARLADGKAVTLVDATGGPAWSRWSRGAEACQVFARKDRPFAFGTMAAGMLKLLADPQKERYRFSAEVRHDDVANVGDVGLYFGFTTDPTPDGVAHYWCQLSFADRGGAQMPFLKDGPRGEPQGKVGLIRMRQLEPGSDLKVMHIRDGYAHFPAFRNAAGTPWRRLAVEVTPERVQALWEGKPIFAGRGYPTLELSQLPNLPINKGDPVAHFKFAPRGSLGLFVNRGMASFRNVKVEPLE
jgi:serine/threonine-protein kinase